MTTEPTTVVLAAGPVLGSVGMSGLALTTGIVLWVGLRGSDRVSLNRDKAGGIGIAFGTIAVAAGSLWGDVATGVAGVPTSLIAGSVGGDVGLGGTALALTAVTFLPRWKRLMWPALFGLSAGVIYAQAGGIWAIGHNLVIKLAAVLGAM